LGVSGAVVDIRSLKESRYSIIVRLLTYPCVTDNLDTVRRLIQPQLCLYS